jgi:hypothetical protein
MCNVTSFILDGTVRSPVRILFYIVKMHEKNYESAGASKLGTKYMDYDILLSR